MGNILWIASGACAGIGALCLSHGETMGAYLFGAFFMMMLAAALGCSLEERLRP